MEELRKELIDALRKAVNGYTYQLNNFEISDIDTPRIERLTNLLSVLLHYEFETHRRDELIKRCEKLEAKVFGH